jgi:beta-xylosidase
VHWEWNHNPNTTQFTVNDSLTLYTATLTTDLYKARNTLTHRVHGPLSTATIVLCTSAMADGDIAGLAAFRDATAYIGISRNGSTYTISNRQGLIQDPTASWATTSNGTVVASANLAKGKVWLRGIMLAAANSAHTARFEYSVNGNTYLPLGTSYVMNQDYRYFMGYRWGIFNYATKTLGGSVKVESFTQG